MFAGINDQLNSRGLLSRLREPTTAEDAALPIIKVILVSMGEIMDVLKEGGFQLITPKHIFCVVSGISTPSEWTKVCVYNDSATLKREM